MPAQSVDILILAATIASIPTVAIAAFGFAMRRSGDLSTLLAAREAQDKAIDRIETTLREERDKRDKLEQHVYEMPAQFADRYVLKEDFVRNAGQIDHKFDALSGCIDRLSVPPPTAPRPDGPR